MKKQPTGQQEIFANNISDKGLMSKMYKELIQLDSKNKKHSDLKKTREGGKRPEETFLKRHTNDQHM